MLRNLAILLLLPAVLLNGLWIVCNPPDPAAAAERAAEFADCIRICAVHEASFGRICILWPGENKSSITVFDFGVAILPSEIVVPTTVTGEQVAAELPVSYWDPSLSNHTPPPKA